MISPKEWICFSLKKIVGLFLFFLIQSVAVYSQSQDFDKNTFLSGFEFSVIGSSGLTKFIFDPPTTISLKSPLLTQSSVDLEVQYYFNQRISLSATIGYLTTTHKNHQKVGGMEWYKYRDGLAWIGYRKFDFGLGLSKFLNSKLFLRPKLKVGGMYSKKRNALTRRQDGSRIQALSKVNPFILTQANLGFILRQYNVLNIGVYYRYSFSNLYEGTYFDFPEPIAFSGSGTELGINLGYSFTSYRRKFAKTKSKRQFHEYLKSYRDINDRARFLQVSVNRFAFVNKQNDPEGIVVNSISKRFGIRVEAEFGLKENRFLETGVHVGEYFTGQVILDENADAPIAQSESGPDYQLALSGGYGYRIITKKKINLLTLSAGIAVNATLSGSSGNSSLFDNATNQYIYNIEYNDEIKTLIYPSVYVSLNKDFKLTKKTFLCVNYRYSQGIINSIIRNYEVVTHGSDIRNFEGIRNGTSSSLGLGLKFNLGEKKNQDQEGR